jgi:hypothetical protein
MLLTRWLYLRALGFTALIAIGSFWAQLDALIGSRGIAPARLLMEVARQRGETFFDRPTLCWLSASDAMLNVLAAAGAVLSLLLIAGLAPRIVLALTWLCWLSLVEVGGPFLSFQWDVLLLEALALSIPFAPGSLLPKWGREKEPTAWSRWLLAFVAFKVTFCSGVVKIASGDPSWRDFTALSYHYWTQPLPTWTSYVANQMPMAAHKITCALMYVLELPLAACSLGPRPLRRIGAVSMATLQVTLGLMGNYAYFNLLALTLTLPLLDDDAVKMFSIKRWPFPSWTAVQRVERRWLNRAGWGFVAFTVVFSFFEFTNPAALGAFGNAVMSFDTINRYGAFAVMTKTRAEIIVEGSDDGTTWKPYEFKYKPGDVDMRPKWISPLQPRLDWQMWFAALRPCGDRWFISFQHELLTGNPVVLGLLEKNPFATAPPKFLRTQQYQYRFAPRQDKGVWWTRTLDGPYCPALTLGPNGQMQTVAE